MSRSDRSKVRFISRSRSRICACTVTSSAVVGSSAMTSGGLQASATASITRWRMPARQLVGVVVDALFGLDDLDGAAAARSPARAPRACRPCPCTTSASATWAPTRITGFSAAIGSWNTRPMPAPRTAHISRLRRASRSRPWKSTRPPVMRPAGGSSRSTEKAVTDLPLPDSPTRPERLAAPDLERHVVHGDERRARRRRTPWSGPARTAARRRPVSAVPPSPGPRAPSPA